jgi:hypothetical protein
VIDVGNDAEIADELELQIEDSGLFGGSEGGTRKYNRTGSFPSRIIGEEQTARLPATRSPPFAVRGKQRDVTTRERFQEKAYRAIGLMLAHIRSDHTIGHERLQAATRVAKSALART